MSNLNNFSAEDKASILVEALPYIQESTAKPSLSNMVVMP